MNNITIIGRPAVVCGGEKGTSFRDKDGNWHAQFYQGLVGGLVGMTRKIGNETLNQVEGSGLPEGTYVRVRFGVGARDAERLGNMGMGTMIRIECRVKTKLNAANKPEVRKFVAPDGTVTFDVAVEDIEVLKKGFDDDHRILYFADVAKGRAETAEESTADKELGL